MGVFEMEKFAAGTNDVAKTLAECTAKGAITIIGGGDSVAAVEAAGVCVCVCVYAHLLYFMCTSMCI